MDITRRHLIQTGVVVGLGSLVAGTETTAAATEAVPLHPRRPGTALWAGDATQTTVEITGYTGYAKSDDLIGLRTALSADMKTGPLDHPAHVHNKVGFNKWSVTDLTAGTSYWHQLHVNGVPTGPVCRFRTLRPIGVPCTTTIAVGGCKRGNAKSNTFDDMVSWAPDRVMNLGDLGYPDRLNTNPKTHEWNWAAQLIDPPMLAIQAQGCVDYIASDHDTTGGLDNPSNLNNPISAANLVAWQEMIPARMADQRTPRRGRYRSEVEGNVRFIKLDTRNQDRTDVRASKIPPDDPRSSMLGATQRAWLLGEIDEAAVAGQFCCIFSDVGWYGTADLGADRKIMVSNSDKWIAYIYERDLISDHITEAYARQGKGCNAMVVNSDTHALQQDSGETQRNGLAVITAGPFDQHVHCLSPFIKAYAWTYPLHADKLNGRHRQQSYQQLTFAETEERELTVTCVARDCSNSPAVDLRTMRKTYSL